MPQRLNQVKQTAILTWIETALSIAAIWDKQNLPKPPLPYISCNIISGPQLDGTPESKYKSLDTYTYILRKIFTLSIQIHATTNHLAYLSSLIDSMVLPSFRQILRDAELSIYNDTDIIINDISELLDTGFEKRASIDVTMAYADEVDDLVGEINFTNIQGISGTKFEKVNITI